LPETDLSLLIQAARAAGDIATGFWGQSYEVWDKDDNAGPVTQADLQIDKMLKSTLMAQRPDYGWLSEETPDTSDRLTCDYCFIIDPLDGTRSFVAGERTWAHSLAIAKHGRIQTAVVYVPLWDLMYTADRDVGAFVNNDALRVSAAETITGARVITTRPAMSAEHWKNQKCPEFSRHFRPSLAYRMALVAQGRYDAMLTLRDSWEWDIAAGALLIEMAGGAVSDKYGTAIQFNAKWPKTRGIVAGAPAPHRDLIAALDPQ